MKEITWINAYEQSIGNITGYKKRLRELLIWDKPICDKSNDKSGHWSEWAKKCSALEFLIKEAHPNMKITLGKKIILN